MATGRTKARKRALDVLYAAEMRDESPLDALSRFAEEELLHNDYSEALVRGVVEHQQEIDTLLSDHSQAWSLERMPAVDRNVLRIGVFELLHGEDVPPQTAVSEAVGLVSELSTDDSPKFVNGVLDAIRRGL